jgi:glycosyltransferase involved in cell wall biosynthesis
MIKVCHISSVHKSNDVRIFLKECSALAKNNYEVSLIVANAKTETTNDVNIKGVHSIVNNRFGRVFKTVYKVYRAAKKENANVYHLHDPELLFVALFLKSKHNRVIFDSHEDLPRQLLTKYWIPSPLRKSLSFLTERFENYITKRIDGVVAATPFIRERFLKINPNTVDINNYPIIKELMTSDTIYQKEDSVVYVGGVTKERGILELVKSLALCKEKVKLNLAGIFSPEPLINEIQQIDGWEKVNYKGFLNRTEIRQILCQSKAGIVTLYPTINYLDSLPIKMFEYMACGLPIIVSNFPYWVKLLESENCAIFVDPKNENEIARAIDYIIKNEGIATEMGERGKKLVLQKFNWEVEEQKLLAFYSQIVN